MNMIMMKLLMKMVHLRQLKERKNLNGLLLKINMEKREELDVKYNQNTLNTMKLKMKMETNKLLKERKISNSLLLKVKMVKEEEFVEK